MIVLRGPQGMTVYIVREAKHIYKCIGASAIRTFASEIDDKKYQRTVIDSNLTFESTSPEHVLEHPKRPLVLLLSWLAAKKQHIDRFSRVYLRTGCDVLIVKLHTTQLLLPKTGAQVVAQNVVNFVQREEFKSRPILVNGFSTGGYLYSEIIQKMQQAEEVKGEITSRVIGQIYDSVADLNSIPDGISKALLRHDSLGQKAMSKSLQAYLNLMERPATQYYRRGSRVFHNNPINVPTLFIYSKADPVGCHMQNEAVIENLRTKLGYDNIETKVFDNSPHVSHMYKHKEEYLGTLKWFLERLDYFRERFVDEEWGRIVKVLEDKKNQE